MVWSFTKAHKYISASHSNPPLWLLANLRTTLAAFRRRPPARRRPRWEAFWDIRRWIMARANGGPPEKETGGISISIKLQNNQHKHFGYCNGVDWNFSEKNNRFIFVDYWEPFKWYTESLMGSYLWRFSGRVVDGGPFYFKVPSKGEGKKYFFTTKRNTFNRNLWTLYFNLFRLHI